MRIAIIDVGTNTTRLFVADLIDQRIEAEIDRVSHVTRLGAGVDATGVLAAASIERERAVLREFCRLIDKHRPDRCVAVMTSAVRDAENGARFAEEVAREFRFDVHILTGDQEARLTYLGATGELDPAQAGAGRILVLDIGGGSTELVIGQGRRVEFHVSTQAGVVRQADRHIHQDPPTADELREVALDVRDVLERAVPAERRDGVELALAVAGTPTSLAAIAQDLEPYDPARVHGFTLSAKTRDAILARLCAMRLEQRRRVAGLHPDRALAILPGIVILAEVMDLFGLDEVQVSEHDILRGAAVAYAT